MRQRFGVDDGERDSEPRRNNKSGVETLNGKCVRQKDDEEVRADAVWSPLWLVARRVT